MFFTSLISVFCCRGCMYRMCCVHTRTANILNINICIKGSKHATQFSRPNDVSVFSLAHIIHFIYTMYSTPIIPKACFHRRDINLRCHVGRSIEIPVTRKIVCECCVCAAFSLRVLWYMCDVCTSVLCFMTLRRIIAVSLVPFYIRSELLKFS